MPIDFLGKRLLVLTAHPDDEGIAAGTMYENYKAGGETYLICATYGEKGKAHLAKPVSDAILKKIRKNELLKAAKVLHVNEVFFLGLPDTGVREHAMALYEKSAAIVRKVQPEQILSFGPDGGSGHWDHITAAKVAVKLAKKFKIPLATVTFPRFTLARRRKLFMARRKFGKYATLKTKHRKSDIKIKINPAIKRKAMSNHKSQFGNRLPFASLPKRVQAKMMSEEHFVREKI